MVLGRKEEMEKRGTEEVFVLFPLTGFPERLGQ